MQTVRKWAGTWIRWTGQYLVAPLVIAFGRRPEGEEMPATVHMLVSSKTWRMGLLALLSFEYFTGRRWKLVIHEDGTVSESARKSIEAKLPGCRFVSRRESDEVVSAHLARHPACLRNRGKHNLFLKFFDVGPYLTDERFIVLDSDLFFFQRPQRILDWAEQKESACYYNQDTKEVYALPRDQIREATGVDLWERFNSGLVLMMKEAVSLDRSELLLERCESIAHHPQFFEQTLYALNASAFGAGGPLPPEYEISWTLLRRPGSICRHYVGPFKFDNLYMEGPITLFLHMTLPSLFHRKQGGKPSMPKI